MGPFATQIADRTHIIALQHSNYGLAEAQQAFSSRKRRLLRLSGSPLDDPILRCSPLTDRTPRFSAGFAKFEFIKAPRGVNQIGTATTRANHCFKTRTPAHSASDPAPGRNHHRALKPLVSRSSSGGGGARKKDAKDRQHRRNLLQSAASNGGFLS